MTPWRRSPRPLTFAIDAIRDALAPATLLADVQRAWTEAVGKAISAEAKPTEQTTTGYRSLSGQLDVQPLRPKREYSRRA